MGTRMTRILRIDADLYFIFLQKKSAKIDLIRVIRVLIIDITPSVI